MIMHHQAPSPKKLVWLLVGLFFLANWGCLALGSQTGNGTQTAAPTITVTQITITPSTTPTQTLTLEILKPFTSTPLSPVPTQTPLPTYTPVPPTRTPLSQAATFLRPGGPWLLMGGKNGLWAANPDSTGLVRLDDKPVEVPKDLGKAISPKGNLVAYITFAEPKQKRDPILKILKMPDGIILNSYHLTSSKTVPEPGVGRGDTVFEANRAILDENSLAWSPDGRILAFIGAQEGNDADIYIYKVDEARAYRLTSELAQAYRPVWAPDGVYLTYWGVKSFGNGNGFVMQGAWSVVVDGAETLQLYETNGLPNSNEEMMQGWASNREIVVGSWNATCGNYNIRKVNVKNAVETNLYPGCYSASALDQDNADLIYAVSDFDVKYCICSKTVPDRGVYLLKNGRSNPEKLGDMDLYNFTWLDKVDMFLASVNDGWETAFTPDGQTIKLPESIKNLQPVVSPISGRWAWTGINLDGEQGVWVGSLKDKPEKIYAGPAQLASWSPDGQALFFWTDDGQLFKAGVPAFKLEKIGNGFTSSATWMIP
jgi:hypothetical protein